MRVECRNSILGDASLVEIDLSSQDIWFPAGERDFTIQLETGVMDRPASGGWQKQIIRLLGDPAKQADCHSLAEKVQVRFPGNKTLPARMLAAFAENNRILSLTLRFDQKTPTDIKPFAYEGALTNTSGLVAKRRDPKFLFDADATADVLLQSWGMAIPVTQDPKARLKWPLQAKRKDGLIIIAGATSTGKSLLARTVALRYLLALASDPKAEVPPHCVTFEDPIESWMVEDPAQEKDHQRDLLNGAALGVNLYLTARERGKDVPSLEAACRDALRQTPACFFIGEVRHSSDWEHALSLATTGHLVMATTHAASLPETFAKVCGPKGIASPFSRGSIAQAIRGVVHLIGTPVNNRTEGFSSLWRNTPESVNNFKSSGLSSLIVDGNCILGYGDVAHRVFERMKRTGVEVRDEVNGMQAAERLDLLKP